MGFVVQHQRAVAGADDAVALDRGLVVERAAARARGDEVARYVDLDDAGIVGAALQGDRAVDRQRGMRRAAEATEQIQYCAVVDLDDGSVSRSDVQEDAGAGRRLDDAAGAGFERSAGDAGAEELDLGALPDGLDGADVAIVIEIQKPVAAFEAIDDDGAAAAGLDGAGVYRAIERRIEDDRSAGVGLDQATKLVVDTAVRQIDLRVRAGCLDGAEIVDEAVDIDLRAGIVGLHDRRRLVVEAAVDGDDAAAGRQDRAAGVVVGAIAEIDGTAIDRLEQIEIVEAAVEDEGAAVGGLHGAVIAALTAAATAATATA